MGRVYLAPHGGGGRVSDWHSHHWKRVSWSKPPDPGPVRLALENHLITAQPAGWAAGLVDDGRGREEGL